MSKLSVRDLNVRGKRLLVRVDFNVPTEERNDEIIITDDTRIRESLPTINYLREQGAKAILMAHFGRPKGQRVEKYSLRPIGVALHNLIDHPVAFSHDCIGADAEKIVADMEDGDVTLLENLRFHAGEEANDPVFAESSMAIYESVHRALAAALAETGKHAVVAAIGDRGGARPAGGTGP